MPDRFDISPLKNVKRGFAGVLVAMKIKAPVRSIWSTEAAKRDRAAGTQLGTLNYLPLEIRESIYALVLYDSLNEHKLKLRSIIDVARTQAFEPPYLTCRLFNYPWLEGVPYEFDPPLRWKYHPRWIWPAKIPIHELKQASDDIRTEFDRMFLSRCTFRFRCLRAFVGFFSRIPVKYHNRVRRIIIQAFIPCPCCLEKPDIRSWKDPTARLPATLDSLSNVKFDLGD